MAVVPLDHAAGQTAGRERHLAAGAQKQVNDNLTLRMTGGTYFRLLNMYEIAGDGAGILPVPANKRGTASKFPQPEYGTQFDFSTLWNGKFLHSDAYATLTYFWRHANRMLYLYRAGPDWASYFNDQKGIYTDLNCRQG